jgi:hypothetical protein
MATARKRPVSETSRFVCTLDHDDAPRRREQMARLARQLTDHATDGERRARLTFPATAAPLVEEFVRDESACCSFFTFAVEPAGESVRLRITAPEGAEGILHGLLDALGR